MHRILTGDVAVHLPALEVESFDACLCDPPYGLGFMGKEWDSPGKSFFERKAKTANAWDHVGGNHNPANSKDKQRTTAKENAGFQAWCEEWAREVYRVLKPGGFLLAFGGTRTYHRLACAIEDAGFEIRDCLSWMYGQGFPKSLDISKALDKAAGAEREVVGRHTGRRATPIRDIRGGGLIDNRPNNLDASAITAPATDAARRWQGYGTALKPAWEPIIVAMKPLDGTFAANAVEYGVAGINVDGCRIATGGESMGDPSRWDKAFQNKAEGWARPSHSENAEGYADRRAEALAKASHAGRWPANVILSHTEECRDGECSPDCPVRMLDEQSGEVTSGANPTRRGSEKTRAAYGEFIGQESCEAPRGIDTGGASRFFYCAKASRSEREAGLREAGPSSVWGGEDDDLTPGKSRILPARNHHPTVKPIAVAEWLARLILPPARKTPRRLLVPFSGSGSEMIGALRVGWDEVVGIEREAEYVAIAEARILELSSSEPQASELALEAPRAPARPRQRSLFD